MSTVMRLLLVVLGSVGLLIYFRSIIRMMLLNRRERDFLQRGAARIVIAIVHGLARGKRTQAQVKHAQAWLMPLFIFCIVLIWFLLVQISFSLILWGVNAESSWVKAMVASGSALSTLGFQTPKTLTGQLLAIGEAAIGLGIVILLFTFVPGYQAAVQVRERKGGWLHSRTIGAESACLSLLESLQRSGRTHDASVWESWEDWFRGVLETHAISPILAYVPSIYRGNWVDTAATVLDAVSLVLVSADSKDSTEAARLCRATGISALHTIAGELVGDRPKQAGLGEVRSADTSAALGGLYDKLRAQGVPIATDKERWVHDLSSLRADYVPSLRHISRATLMPVHEPWQSPLSDDEVHDRS